MNNNDDDDDDNPANDDIIIVYSYSVLNIKILGYFAVSFKAMN